MGNWRSQIRTSSTKDIPDLGDLVDRELAYSFKSNTLFIRNPDGGIEAIGGATTEHVLTTPDMGAALAVAQEIDFTRPPTDEVVVGIKAILSRASTTGPVVIDVNVNDVSILGADKLTIEQGEVSTYTSDVHSTILLPNISSDSKVSIDIDHAGANAKGLKVIMVVKPTVFKNLPAVPVPTGAPTITGEASVGSTVHATTGNWLHVPDRYAYEWLLNGVMFDWTSGANLVVPPQAAGKNLSVRVRAGNAGGSAEQVSLARAVTLPAPLQTSPALVTGLAIEEQIVSVDPGTWLFSPTFQYQWLLDGAEIAGATHATLGLLHAWVNHHISCRVRATNATDTVEVVSADVVVNQLVPGWDYTMPLPTRSGAVGAREFNVGPGKQFEELSGVPWQTLIPGDHIRIHYRPTPYAAILFVGARGRADAWIEIEGVPGPGGQRPEITGAGGTSASGLTTMPGLVGAGVVIIGRPTAGENPQPYGYKPGYIWIHGLKIGGARPPATYFNDAGLPVPFGAFVSGIYANPVEHLTVSNCQLSGNSLGLFVNSRNNADAQSRNIHVYRNYFTDNGKSSDASVHNCYTEAIGTIIEYNYFDPLAASVVALGGDCIKDRSAGQIIRYNYFKRSGAYTISLRDPDSNYIYESGQVDNLYDKLISHAFVYGNFFELQDNTLLSDGDGDFSAHGVNLRYGDICFYSNIVVSRKNYVNAGHDEVTLFSPYNYTNPLGNTTYRVFNNMFFAGAALSGASTPAPMELFLRAGKADFSQNKINNFMNVSPNPGGYTEGVWAGIPFNGSGLGGLTAEAYDPQFLDFTNENYELQPTSPFYSLSAPLATSAAVRDLWPDDFAPLTPPLLSEPDFVPFTLRPTATERPSISGTPEIGQTLTLDLGTWTGAPTITVQWTRDGAPIDLATGATYDTVTADGGHSISANVYAANAYGRSYRSASPKVIAVDTRAPSNTARPTISGGTGAGSLLTGDPGSWASIEEFTLRYQWYVNGNPVPDQTGLTYQTIGSQVGAVVMFRAWAANSFGEGDPADSDGLTLGAAVAAEPDSSGLFNFNFPDLTTLADINPAWAGPNPSRYQVYSNALRIAPGLGITGTWAVFASGVTSATTQRVTVVRRGSSDSAGFYAGVAMDTSASGGYTVMFAGDAAVLRRNGALLDVQYYSSLASPPNMAVDNTFVLELAGGVVRVLINGQVLSSYTDASPYTTGYGAIMTTEDSFLFESLKIERF